MEKASVIAINRHRINSDGPGVRTLVALEGCNLNCKYCINPSCRGKGHGTMMSAEEVYNAVVKDDIYIMAAGGGVTFGGGEPLLWPQFIKEYIDISKYELGTTIIETSLNVPIENLKVLSEDIRYINFIVDIKDLNRHIYEKYTGKNILPMLENLEWLINNNHYGVKVRVPHIPGYNSEKDIKRSKEILATVFDDFSIEEFDYVIDADEFEDRHAFEIGKCTCDSLKKIRTTIAHANDIDFTPHECHSTNVCSGSCEMCDDECEFIKKKLLEKVGHSLDGSQINLYRVYKEALPKNEIINRKIYKVQHHLDGIIVPTSESSEKWDIYRQNERWLMDQLIKNEDR